MYTFSAVLLVGGVLLAVVSFIYCVCIMVDIVHTKNMFKSFGVGMIFMALGGVAGAAGFYLGAFNFIKGTILPLFAK